MSHFSLRVSGLLLLGLIYFFGFAHGASAATYWVRPTGTMSGCTPSASAPGADSGYKATVAAGIGCLANGDTLMIRGGTYNEVISDTQFDRKSGFSYSAPTTIQAYGTEAVTLTGGIAFQAPAGVYTSYIIFQADPVAHNFSTPGIRVGQAGNTGLAQNIKFDGLDVGNIGNSDAIIATGENAAGPVWFTHMHVHTATGCNNNGSGPNAVHAFYIQTPNVIIEYTEIDHVTGQGIQNYDEAGGQSSNNIYRFNYLHDIGYSPPVNCIQTGFPIGLTTGTGHQVYGNIIANTPTSSSAGWLHQPLEFHSFRPFRLRSLLQLVLHSQRTADECTLLFRSYP